MTESETKPPTRAARRRWRRAHTALAAVLIVTVAAGGAVYVTRRAIAREVLVGWLEARGVPADVEFRDFEFGGFTARVRAGPAADPDFSAERVEARYGLTGPWAGQPLGVQVLSVKLYRPVVKGALRNGKLKFGSLDPLIEEFTKKPPRPEAPQPHVEIHGAVARLATDYGLLKARADGRLENGKLMALDARLDPVALKGPDLAARLGEARLRLATTRDRTDILLTAPVAELAAGDLTASEALLVLSVQGPYPDLKKRRGDGKVMARLDLTGERAALGRDRLDGLRLTARFDGESKGWIKTLALNGNGGLTASVRGGRAAGVDLADLKAEASLGDLRWTRTAGDVISGEISSRVSAGQARSGDLTLTGAHGDFGGLMAFDERRLDVALRGALASRGAWRGLGAARAGDPPETAALKRALAGFQFTASSVAVSASREELAVSLGVPMRLRTDSGGEVSLYRAGGPIYANGAGAFDLKVAGGGLPDAALEVPRYRLTKDGLLAAAALKAKGGFAPVSDGSIDAAGEVRLASGRLAFSAGRCAALSAAHVELGDSDVEKLDGQLCPSAAGPMFSLADGAWRLRGEARGLSGELPFLEVRLSEAAGPVDLGGAGANLSGQVAVAAARLDDTAAETRFRPVRASGRAWAAGGGWTGEFAVTDLAGRRLGTGGLRHGADGRGTLDFDTGALVFEDGGLQPAALSPFAAVLGSPAQGQARFSGQVGWAPGTSTSHGKLMVERLDFVSPMGPVVGLSGQADFISLIPLTAAPGQVLKAQEIKTLVPLTDVDVRFSLEAEAAVVEGAQFDMGGGKLVFEPFTVPFKPGAPWKGVLKVEGVQIRELVEASPFGDRVDLDARLSGRLPFEVTPDGVRVRGGALRAIEPGRLSIQREALTPVASQGGAAQLAAPSTPAEAVVASAVEGAAAAAGAGQALAPSGQVNAFSEFAYQAMEHLSFETLEAQVDSQENGRLGVLMHLKGEHTPPRKQEIRLTLWDLIKRDFLNRQLPLPSGTKVDLTLDTSLNLDQILRDFADYQALRGSQAVQP